MTEINSFRNKRVTNRKGHPFIPYGRQCIDEADIQAVIDALRSDWITTGPKVEEFEKAFAVFVGARESVAVSSGTAALHSAMNATGIGPGDEVILPPMTFLATANAIVFQGGIPIFSDVDSSTLLIAPDKVESKITPRTKAIVAVDYAGQPCDYNALKAIADHHGLVLVADACHALGAEYRGEKVGTLADLTVFSFHPVKHITTGEGGMIVTKNHEFAEKMRRFRNHGITADHHKRAEHRTWHYEMADLGYNYRITDFQCALGLSQLRKLPGWISRRRDIAGRYNECLSSIKAVKPLSVRNNIGHAYHLYVIRVDFSRLCVSRTEVFAAMRHAGIGVNVHYIPVHLHPYYRAKFNTRPGMCPVAEHAYEEIISLPIFSSMNDSDIEYVVATVRHVLTKSDKW